MSQVSLGTKYRGHPGMEPLSGSGTHLKCEVGLGKRMGRGWQLCFLLKKSSNKTVDGSEVLQHLLDIKSYEPWEIRKYQLAIAGFLKH